MLYCTTLSNIVKHRLHVWSEVHTDLLHVIAYGPTVSKVAAANLLFFYWPALNPTPAERKDIADRFSPDTTWIPNICRWSCQPTSVKFCLFPHRHFNTVSSRIGMLLHKDPLSHL